MAQETLPPSLLLIASDRLQDPNFRRTVVLVLQTPGGPFGFVLNRPSPVTVGEVLPQAPPALAAARVYAGGPVSPRTVGALFSAPETPPRSLPVLEELYFSVDPTTIAGILGAAEPPRRLRVFAGYAGWAPGQLESELARGDWWVWPADESTVFDIPAERLWPLLYGRATARRAGVPPLPARGHGGWPGAAAGASVEDLKEHLVLADHAEFGAGALFDRVRALLEIPDLGVERGIARAQPGVVIALPLDAAVEIAHREPASLAHPQRILQRGQERQQHGSEQLHWRSW